MHSLVKTRGMRVSNPKRPRFIGETNLENIVCDMTD
jgi:hypothetical protein